MRDTLRLTSKGTEYLARSERIKDYAEAKLIQIIADNKARAAANDADYKASRHRLYRESWDAVMTLEADCMAQQEAIDAEYQA